MADKPNVPGFAKQRILKAVINRIDLVPAGANTESHVVLFKSKGGQEMKRTYEKIKKSLSEEEQEVLVAELQKEKDATEIVQKSLNAANVNLGKETTAKSVVQGLLDVANETIAKGNGNEDKELTGTELILKSLDGPAKVAFVKMQKTIDDAKVETEKLEKEAFDKSMTDEIEDISFAKSVEGFEDNYKKLAKESPKLKEMLLGILKQVEAVIDTSELFKELGSSADGADEDPEEELDRLAKERAKVDKITFEKAYTLVLEENPELYQG